MANLQYEDLFIQTHVCKIPLEDINNISKYEPSVPKGEVFNSADWLGWINHRNEVCIPLKQDDTGALVDIEGRIYQNIDIVYPLGFALIFPMAMINVRIGSYHPHGGLRLAQALPLSTIKKLIEHLESLPTKKESNS